MLIIYTSKMKIVPKPTYEEFFNLVNEKRLKNPSMTSKIIINNSNDETWLKDIPKANQYKIYIKLLNV